VTVAAPWVNDRRVDPDSGERHRFCSAILPAWARRSPQMTEVLPLLYLDGLSTGNFGAALEQFLDSGAGLSRPRSSAGVGARCATRDRETARAPRSRTGSRLLLL